VRAAFTFLETVEIFLDAVFLWIMPFEAALLSNLIVGLTTLSISSLFFDDNAVSTFFIWVLISVFTD